ncbi:MAG: ATP synthase subunit I [Moraxellaceae bacterium]|nr:ATP synthase subunit I [Moraxellaceae bacterium]MDZ4386420.1 ATP synthase subunit I [Moraxellaceae bacterium]
MSKPQPLLNVKPALQQLIWQIVFLLPLAVVAGLLAGVDAALSALAGAVIVLIGQIYFVSRAFRHAGATSARHIVREFFRGEAGKFLLTVLLFAAALISFDQIRAGWLLTGFILQQLVGSAALIRTKSN